MTASSSSSSKSFSIRKQQQQSGDDDDDDIDDQQLIPPPFRGGRTEKEALTNKVLPITYNFNKTVAAIGPYKYTYGWWNKKKLKQFHDLQIQYDGMHGGRICKVGSHTFQYGMQGRLNKVGNGSLTFKYGRKGRLNGIGPDYPFKYGALKGRLNQVGPYLLEYGFWGRLNGIHLLGDALTEELLLVIFLVIHHLECVEQEKKLQTEREKQAKLVLEGKKQVK